MSRDGWLPPGVTDADIDRAMEPFEPFYCVNSKCHCAELGLAQCELCEWEESQASKESNNDEPRHDNRSNGEPDTAA
jgi:hypothetical protein